MEDSYIYEDWTFDININERDNDFICIMRNKYFTNYYSFIINMTLEDYLERHNYHNIFDVFVEKIPEAILYLKLSTID